MVVTCKHCSYHEQCLCALKINMLVDLYLLLFLESSGGATDSVEMVSIVVTLLEKPLM